MDTDVLLRNLINSLLFSAIGLVVFVVGFYVIRLVMPYDVHKEIEQDHNVALGIVVGAFILGLALIVAAAIHGG